jgi:tetratricopeptide (TPR) repeat protein
VRRACAAALLALAGCAGPLGLGSGRAEDAATLAAWRTLEEGRVIEARAAFEARLRAAPEDVLARFGRATIAYEHGEPAAALDDYTAALAAMARGAASAPTIALLAPVASARALALDDDVSPSVRHRAEAALLALPAAKSEGTALPWPARLELARLGDRAARRAGDAEALDREASRRGCARAVFDAGTLGPLPHLDLDRSSPPTAPATWRPAIVSGCRVVVTTREGRPAAVRLRAAAEVPAGTYDLVLDYDGRAAVSVDGSAALAHGSETLFGPRVSAFPLVVPAGRHDVEVRIAATGGRAELALVLMPRAAGVTVRFVDPRVGAPGQGAAPGASPPPVSQGPDEALLHYGVGFAAHRAGDTDAALSAAAWLSTRRRFALGLALAGAIQRDDPTRPAGVARDAARGLFRAALDADAGAARAAEALAAIELEDEHLRDAIDDARLAARAAPRWWAPEVVLAHALRARGLELDADKALDRAAGVGGAPGDQPCLLVEALLRRADDRRDLRAREDFEAALAKCDATSEVRLERLRARGDLGAEERALRTSLALAPDRDDLGQDLAKVLGAEGRRKEAIETLAALVRRSPDDPFLRVRLADAQAAAGQTHAARETALGAMALRPDSTEVRRMARALGVALPLDAFRLDGRTVIEAFEASRRRYAAPAVVVLDRSVERVFPNGATLTLTHEIVRVQSKDAIDRWAEVDVPAGAEVLTLRTHKPDGTTREPEEIAGKETVSAANVAIGDYIEWELLEARAPSPAFAPGFLGDRFYFQSFDAPLDRTELVLVSPRGGRLSFDRRGGAPAPQTTDGPEGTAVTTFAGSGVPQLYVERAAVPPIEYVPSVRASSGVDFRAWTRYVAEQLAGTTRSSPALRERARQLAAEASRAPAAGRSAAIVSSVVGWVTENVDAVDDLRDGATQALARGSGNRVALILALLREAGVRARPVLARSLLSAPADAAAPIEELDDFADTVLEVELGDGRALFVDPRLRHAEVGYLPPSLDGARSLTLPDGGFGVARSSATADHRSVDVTIRLDEQGGAAAIATEELTGWPALEWAELVEKLGADRARLRQDFEQRWLGVQFPGARLGDLDVTLPKKEGAAAAVRVRYSFVSSQLTVKGDHEMRLLPTFFRSQPGRRFATEPRRSTALMLGFDVPFHMTATVELPRAAKVVDEPDVERVERKGAYRFVEERRLRSAAGTTGAPASEVLVLTREALLPLSRVSPTEYPGVAADLRRVDALEQREIRIRLRGGAKGAR